MRLFPVLIVLAVLAGCLSPETRAEIDRLSGIVAALEVRAAAAPADEALRAELEAARSALDAARSDAIKERIGDAAAKVEAGAEGGKSIAGYVFPPAVVVLGIIAAVAGALKGIGKKRPPTPTTATLGTRAVSVTPSSKDVM